MVKKKTNRNKSVEKSNKTNVNKLRLAVTPRDDNLKRSRGGSEKNLWFQLEKMLS